MARTFSRKTFLRGAAGATGAVAAGALLGPVRAQALPGESDWKALGTAIDGRVILPSDGQYAAAKSVFNTGFGGSTPAAVITVKSTSDVQKAVAFAASNNVQVAPRSGGHSYIGASAANGAMVIDLRPLSGEVAYDDGSGLVTVPAAADLQWVQTALAAHGRSIPTGSCPSVGAAGLTLGGGLGIDSRAHGLTCDMLASASVVLPSGDEVTASVGDHDDLYWALRGGGGGNFGVTTSLMFRTFPVADQDLVKLQFPFPATAQVIVGWHNWLTKADASMWSMVDITSGPDGQRCGVLLTSPAGAGPGAAKGLIASTGVQAISNENRTLSHIDLAQDMEGSAEANQPHGFVAGSDVVGLMSAPAAQSIAGAVSAWPRAAGLGQVIIKPLDGAVAGLDTDATAFPWRRQAAVVQWYVYDVSTTASRWISTAHAAVQPHSVGGYVNYLEPGTTAARYFAGNLAGLQGVRQKYDPARVMFSGLGL